MLTEEFDYDLPQELIAQQPLEPRDASRLLVLHRQSGQIEHHHFEQLLAYLRPGDLLVANETRVIPARIQARKVPSGGKVELLLLARRDELRWEALVKGRTTTVGQTLDLGGEAPLRGVVEQITPAGARLLAFTAPIEPHLWRLGSVPLPPYVHEPLRDPERYQTVYGRVEGSAAAPTAGLHFTSELIARSKAAGVGWAAVLLHIGLDTFRPVSEVRIEEHQIHSEFCSVSDDVARRITRAKVEGRRVIAVGTTTVRVLETAAQGMTQGVHAWDGPTSLFIYPGYRFRVVDALVTNFHLPRSTLLMLVSALADPQQIRQAYREAVRLRYRFYSFGDAMLIL